jgi:hypothetical protein
MRTPLKVLLAAGPLALAGVIVGCGGGSTNMMTPMDAGADGHPTVVTDAGPDAPVTPMDGGGMETGPQGCTLSSYVHQQFMMHTNGTDPPQALPAASCTDSTSTADFSDLFH